MLNPRPCRCEDVGRGSRVELDAEIPLAGGPLIALRVTVIARPLVTVRGEVVRLDCGKGDMVIKVQLGVRLHVEISPETTIRRGSKERLACGDVRIGDAVRVRGGLIDSPEFLLPVIVADDVLLLGASPATGGPRS